MPKSLLGNVLLGCLVLNQLFAVAQAPKSGAAKKPAAKPAAASGPVVVTPDNLKWGDAPPVLQPGAQLAVLAGNPNGTGPFAIRLKMPDGYKIMPHWHPTQENVTVISGEFHVGLGDKFDETGMQALPVGSYAAMPARHHHYAVAKGETIVQVNGMGPFKLVYVNPDDNPSKTNKSTGGGQ
ncbi:MAG TPA: cupin domain-containing protein [Terriglobales bacterium]